MAKTEMGKLKWPNQKKPKPKWAKPNLHIQHGQNQNPNGWNQNVQMEMAETEEVNNEMYKTKKGKTRSTEPKMGKTKMA